MTQYSNDEYPPRLEFSSDSTMICAYWSSTYRHGDKRTGPPLRVVFKASDGSIVADAVDSHSRLVGTYLRQFPRSVPRTSGMTYAPTNLSVRLATPFPDFLRDSGGWAFNNDFTLGVRMVNPRDVFPPHEKKDLVGGPHLWAIELWRLSPEAKRIWAVDVPDKVADLEEGAFCKLGGKDVVFLAFHPSRFGCLFSQEDGKVVRTIPYGPTQRRSLELRDEEEERGYPHTFSIDSTRNLLASGDFTGRRIRVVAIEDGGKLVFEAHAADAPDRPRGGVWSVERVEFAANGRYLIATYHFGGRGTWRTATPTEIYDTKTWQKVWQDDDKAIRQIIVSPDGKKMAYLRAGTLLRATLALEIVPFSASAALEDKQREDGGRAGKEKRDKDGSRQIR
ncbi:MAG: hypothetical protein ABSF26_04725 [Thermoguttaceae bacterium]|jgi:hypothetical protein